MLIRASSMAALVCFALPVPLQAQEQEAPTTATPALVPAHDPTDSQPETASSPFGASAIDEGSLRTVTGREDTTQVAHANQVAGVTRNSVGDNSVTGDARIDGNAFQNMSGLSILNVNTGNNVAINAAMNVNVSIQPGP